MQRVLIVLVLLLAFPAFAQESASYKLSEHVFNAGGHPADGVVLASATYHVTLDAIGDSVVGRDLTSTSYSMDGGFIPGYPPPGEVLGLHFTDVETLVWHPERSVGVYNLYRGQVNGFDGTVYGSCSEQDIAVTTTTDDDPVPEQNGYYYLVTAENRLGEEGTKGVDTGGSERQGNACP